MAAWDSGRTLFGQRQGPDDPAVGHHVEHRSASLRPRPGAFGQPRGHLRAGLAEQGQAADGDLPAVHNGLHARPVSEGNSLAIAVAPPALAAVTMQLVPAGGGSRAGRRTSG